MIIAKKKKLILLKFWHYVEIAMVECRSFQALTWLMKETASPEGELTPEDLMWGERKSEVFSETDLLADKPKGPNKK